MQEETAAIGNWQATDNDSRQSSAPYLFTPVPFEVENQLDFVEIHQDGTLLLGSSNLTGKYWNGSIWCFKNPDFAPDKAKSLTGIGCDHGVTCGKFLGDSDKIIVGEDTGGITIFSFQELCPKSIQCVPLLTSYTHDKGITEIDVSSDSNKSISSGKDLSIVVWDNETLTGLQKYKPAHGKEVTGVSINKTNEEFLFASTSCDGLLLIWDPRDPRPATSIINNIQEPLTAVDWKNDKEVAVGSEFGRLSLFDIRSRNVINSAKTIDRPIRKITFNNYGLLGICGDFKKVFIWDFSQNEPLYSDDRHSAFVRGLAWHPATDVLYSCGFQKQMFSHYINPSCYTNKLNNLKIV